MSLRHPRRGRGLAAAVAGGLLLASVSLARAAEPRAAGAGTGGSVVAIDATTGALRAPTAAEIAALARFSELRSVVAPQEAVVVQRSDGSRMAQVPEDYMEYAVLGLDAAGRPVAACMTGEAEAQRWLARIAAQPVAAAPALETE